MTWGHCTSPAAPFRTISHPSLSGVLAILEAAWSWRRIIGCRVSDDHVMDGPLDRVPRNVRRGTDQAPRRPLLARLHLPRLPLRNPADAQSAQLVPALGTALDPQLRRGLQSFRRADRAVRPVA